MAAVDVLTTQPVLVHKLRRVENRLLDYNAAIPRLAEMVSIDKIKAHLMLIAAFTSLFHEAEDNTRKLGNGTSNPLLSFLRRGVHRLELWLKDIVVPSLDRRKIELHELPPLDVVALWHTFVLAPFRYFEDCHREFPQLYNSGDFPLLDLVRSSCI